MANFVSTKDWKPVGDIRWADLVDDLDDEEATQVLSRNGFSLDDSYHNVAAIWDNIGIKPGDPMKLRDCVSSLFFQSEVKNQSPIVRYADDRSDQSEYVVDSSLPYGHASRMAYPVISPLPQMNIRQNGDDRGIVAEMPLCDFFGDIYDVGDSPLDAICEQNKITDFNPIDNSASTDFRDVNKAVKKFQSQYQNLIFGEVLIFGSGVVTLLNNFDFSQVSHVTYMDINPKIVDELESRLKDAPFEYSIKIGGLKDIHQLFDVIITNHSWHFVVAGVHPNLQFEMCLELASHLKENGIWLGAGPSIGGSTSTPCTLEVRSPSGLYGFFQEEGAYYVYAQYANARMSEPVFFSSLLHALPGGVGQVVHLSQFDESKEHADLVRMYEGFVFLKSRKRPKKMKVRCTVDEHALSNCDLANAVRIVITGNKPEPVVPQVVATSIRPNFSFQTKGQLLLASHFGSVCFQGPYLMSEKLDGLLHYVEGTGEMIFAFDEGGTCYCLGKYTGPSFKGFAERVAEGFYILEISFRNDKVMPSWLGAFRSWLPEVFGIKNYRSVSKMSFELLFNQGVEGVVLQDPNTPCGSGKPRQFFIKRCVSMDIQDEDGVVRERDGLGGVKDRLNHQPNGFMRALEGPFVVTPSVFLEWLELRQFVKEPDKSGTSLATLFSYPRLIGTAGEMRVRNTAIQQFWRGYVKTDESTREFINFFAPFGRPVGVERLCQELLHSILHNGAPDKDGMISQARAIFDLAKKDEEEAESLVISDVADSEINAIDFADLDFEEC